MDYLLLWRLLLAKNSHHLERKKNKKNLDFERKNGQEESMKFSVFPFFTKNNLFQPHPTHSLPNHSRTLMKDPPPLRAMDKLDFVPRFPGKGVVAFRS